MSNKYLEKEKPFLMHGNFASDELKRWSERLLLIVISVAAMIYRLLPINRGLGQDELFTTVQFIEVPSIFRTIFYNIAFNNHIGYSVMARFSELIFGRTEWALRFPALLFGMATLYILYIFSRALLGRAPALLATLLLALSPAHIGWSVSARGYSGMIFFTLLSSYLFLKLLRQPNRREGILFITVSVFAIYVHLYAIFVTGVQILYLLYLMIFPAADDTAFPSFDKALLSQFRNYFLTIFGLVLLLYIPVTWFMLRDLAGRGRSGFNLFFPGEVAQALTGSASPSMVILILLTSLLGWLSLHRARRIESIYFAWLLLVPLLLMWLVRPFDLYARFFAFWLPYLLILFTTGIVRIFDSTWRGNSTILYLARVLSICIFFSTLFTWTREWQNVVSDEGYREVSQSVVQNADPLAAYCAIGGSRSVWEYYIDKPIEYPLTLAELQEFSNTYPEVRCVYYPAFWQDEGQTEIAQYLFRHASYFRVKELRWFVFRRDGTN